MAAGFSPADFWGLTFRHYDFHMQGAAKRVKREVEMRNRQAWNTAALCGAAFAGKLPKYERVFGGSQSIKHGGEQSPEVQEAALMQLARAWGAEGV